MEPWLAGAAFSAQALAYCGPIPFPIFPPVLSALSKTHPTFPSLVPTVSTWVILSGPPWVLSPPGNCPQESSKSSTCPTIHRAPPHAFTLSVMSTGSGDAWAAGLDHELPSPALLCPSHCTLCLALRKDEHLHMVGRNAASKFSRYLFNVHCVLSVFKTLPHRPPHLSLFKLLLHAYWLLFSHCTQDYDFRVLMRQKLFHLILMKNRNKVNCSLSLKACSYLQVVALRGFTQGSSLPKCPFHWVSW